MNRKDYSGARSALYSLNGCLGDEYLVTISSNKYKQSLKDQSTYQCNHCRMSVSKTFNEGEENTYTKEIQVPTEILISKVHIFEINLPLVLAIFSESKTTKNTQRYYFQT
ncbi:hypothetical protein [Nitrosopumilus ureiphilus]|uniref:hypothetical protein n=1 Tax=Nitrosopumilus ureiphilus TaxID=1470067 RepID=UPI0015C7E566|nr:hypothetical protein [Nitrosopumilus ureiphilus]